MSTQPSKRRDSLDCSDLIPQLDEMLFELQTNELQVCLVPGDNLDAVKDGKMVRAAVGTNPGWCQELCLLNPCTRIKSRTTRKDHTKVKRQYIIKVLEIMIKNQRSRSAYAEYLLGIAADRRDIATQDFEPWDNQF